jgi:hypothetical protein
MWVQERGFLDTAEQTSIPANDTYSVKMTSVDSVFGKLSFLAPPLVFSNMILPNDASLIPYGADEPQWRS